MDTNLNRALGAATVLYSAAIAVRPRLLAEPGGLTPERDGSVPRDTSLLIRVLAARDAAIGAAMIAAKDDRTRRAATLCRVAADVSDALVFGTMLESRTARAKVVGFALSWAALNAWSLRIPST
ncbi:hypothetical protein [Streptomyces sp. NPDC055749]